MIGSEQFLELLLIGYDWIYLFQRISSFYIHNEIRIVLERKIDGTIEEKWVVCIKQSWSREDFSLPVPMETVRSDRIGSAGIFTIPTSISWWLLSFFILLFILREKKEVKIVLFFWLSFLVDYRDGDCVRRKRKMVVTERKKKDWLDSDIFFCLSFSVFFSYQQWSSHSADIQMSLAVLSWFLLDAVPWIVFLL